MLVRLNCSLFIHYLFLSTFRIYNPGRNWFECLRQFDATMLVTLHPVVCPCNWGQGQKVLIRKDVSAKDAAEYKSAEIKPWFRLAPCPDNI